MTAARSLWAAVYHWN